MGDDSTTYEVLVLVEVEDGALEATYLLPLANLIAEANYRLVGVDRDAATTLFAEVACVSFTRGTHITMASGKQCAIEDLKVGDKVLTRDDGAQAVRGIGQTTLRAVGEFAPIVISKGALHNENDLLVSPDHRLFVYQRQDKLGTGRSEVLVKVRHLVNDTTVYRRDGGFVGYFQLLFDDHQIIYAEGIAAESLLIDPRAWPCPTTCARPMAPVTATPIDRIWTTKCRHKTYRKKTSSMSCARHHPINRFGCHPWCHQSSLCH